jgi:hypothetical protein
MIIRACGRYCPEYSAVTNATRPDSLSATHGKFPAFCAASELWLPNPRILTIMPIKIHSLIMKYKLEVIGSVIRRELTLVEAYFRAQLVNGYAIEWHYTIWDGCHFIPFFSLKVRLHLLTSKLTHVLSPFRSKDRN